MSAVTGIVGWGLWLITVIVEVAVAIVFFRWVALPFFHWIGVT